MSVRVAVRNESRHKRLVRRDALERLAERICAAEDVAGVCELSVLLCDDAFIRTLNAEYRRTDRPTDVLAFGQESPVHGGMRVLGDIVISLETVARRCAGDRAAMRDEVRLLFCHGVLHLLGYDHGTKPDRERMAAKQAAVLGIDPESAWEPRPGVAPGPRQAVRRGGTVRFGR